MTKFLGLTGSIGMGKTATAKMFSEAGVPVYDADAAVHAIYEKGGAGVEPVRAVFPDAVIDGAISRSALREIVLGDAEKLATLNAIVHPLLGQTQLDFREQALSDRAALAVLDIPLLFETGGHMRCDYVCVVTAPASIQRERVLGRGTMSDAEFQTILTKQVPDAEKRAQADFIISTAFGFEFARDQVNAIIALMTRMSNDETPT